MKLSVFDTLVVSVSVALTYLWTGLRPGRCYSVVCKGVAGGQLQLQFWEGFRRAAWIALFFYVILVYVRL